MKKIISIPVYVLLTVLCSVFVVSCSEDSPVTPAASYEELDTNSKYDWSYDYLSGLYIDKIYIADSNNIFIAGSPNPLYFDGVDYSPINISDPDFFSSSIDGFDKENVFIGGGHKNNTFANSQLIKLNGKNITVYPHLNDSAGSISDMVIDGPNDVWLRVSFKNYVYRFSNGQFTKYITDPETSGGYIYRNQNKNLILTTLKINSTSAYLYSYIFENDSFQILRKDSIKSSFENPMSFYKSKNMLIKVENQSIYYLNESDWVKICDTKLPGNSWYRLSPQWIAASSTDKLICYSVGAISTPSYYGIYIWDGKEWSWEKEISVNFPYGDGLATDMQIKDDKVYLSLLRFSAFQYSILLKGYQKKLKN